ncbi:MAG: hypothetical protein V2A70_05105 [Candidatus Omnitrophota bacterium]
MEKYTRAAFHKKKAKPVDVKKWVWLGLKIFGAVLGLFIISCTIWFLFSFKIYRSSNDGLEVRYPSQWVVKGHPAKDVLVAFVSPKDNALDTFAENYNFSTYDMSKEPEPMTTKAYADKIVQQTAQVFNDLKLVENIPFIVAGHLGYKMVFRASSTVRLVLSLYVFTIEDKGYNILYLGAVDKFKKDNAILDLVALTAKVMY